MINPLFLCIHRPRRPAPALSLSIWAEARGESQIGRTLQRPRPECYQPVISMGVDARHKMKRKITFSGER